MLKHVTIQTNNIDPSTWTTHEVEDVLALLVEVFPGSFPDTARIYHHSVCQTNDVTPGAETIDIDVARIQSLPGPFFVVVFPEAQALPYIIAIVLAVASYVLAPGVKPLPAVLNRNTQSSSANNELSDRINQARINARIPDIYGTVRSTPDLIAAPYKIFENNREVEYSYMCIGRGEYDISDVRDGETLCSNIPGSTVQIYAPYKSPNRRDVPQITIGRVVEVPIYTAHRSNSVNGQVLRPPNAATFVAIGNVRFVTPNIVELFINNLEDFTKFFVEGDSLTISNAVMTTGVAVTETMTLKAAKEDKKHLINARPAVLLEYAWENCLILEDANANSAQGLFSPGQNITITQTADLNNSGLDLSGTYQVASVTYRDTNDPSEQFYTYSIRNGLKPWLAIELVNPASVNSDWSSLTGNDYANNTQKFVFEVEHESGETYDLDLDGTYTILSVTKEQIVLDDPVSVNADWAIVATHGATPYLSPTLTSSGDKWIGPFVLTDKEMQNVYCNFVAQNGLYKDDGTTQIAASIEIELEVTPVDGTDTPIEDPEFFSLTLLGSANLKETLAQTLKATFSSFYGRCIVRARRITPSDTDFEGTVVDEVRWRDLYSISAIGEQVDFGNVTTVQTVTFATASALAVKERKLNMLVQRKIPEIVSDVPTDTLSGTNDAARILLAICRDKYIGNRKLSEIDVANILATANEVETYFGTARVREFNYTFDKEDFSFEETVDTVARAMFCVAYRRGSVIRLSFEKDTEDSTLLFNHRNKIPGTEKRTVTFGGGSAENDGIEYTYVDPRDDSINTIFLPPEIAALNPKKIESIGIRDHLAGYFHAWRIWNRILYQNQTVEFDATQEADLLIINDRILVSDGTRPNVQEGEVDAIVGTELTLSQLVDLTADPPYTIFLQHFDATVEAIEITAGTDANQVVLADAPVMDLVTAKDRYAKTTYLIVGSNDVTQKAFLVAEKTPIEGMKSTVQAINYHAGYYANDKDFINELITEDGYGDTGGFTPGTGDEYIPPDLSGNGIAFSFQTSGLPVYFYTAPISDLTDVTATEFDNGGQPLLAYDVAVNEGTICFAAIEDSTGLTITSSDKGISYTGIQTAFSGGGNINAIAFGAGVFVAAGGNTVPRNGYSSDGFTWTSNTSAMQSGVFGTGTIFECTGLDFCNGIFIASHVSGKNATSTDGITWTLRSTSLPTDQNFAKYAGDGSGAFILGLIGGRLVASADNGGTWNTSSYLNAVSSASLDSSFLRFGLAYGGGMWVAGGRDSSNSAPFIKYSSVGIETPWASATVPTATPAIKCVPDIVYDPVSEQFIAVASTDEEFGHILTSPDGINWTVAHTVEITVTGAYAGNACLALYPL